MVSPLMVSSKNVEVILKRCLGTSIEHFTGSSLSQHIIENNDKLMHKSKCLLCYLT